MNAMSGAARPADGVAVLEQLHHPRWAESWDGRIWQRRPGRAGPGAGSPRRLCRDLHSHARESFLFALRVLGGDRAGTYTLEALHDCESSVHTLACQTCPTTHVTRTYLRDLSYDPLEDDDVRAAAAQRPSGWQVKPPP